MTKQQLALFLAAVSLSVTLFSFLPLFVRGRTSATQIMATVVILAIGAGITTASVRLANGWRRFLAILALLTALTLVAMIAWGLYQSAKL